MRVDTHCNAVKLHSRDSMAENGIGNDVVVKVNSVFESHSVKFAAIYFAQAAPNSYMLHITIKNFILNDS